MSRLGWLYTWILLTYLLTVAVRSSTVPFTQWSVSVKQRSREPSPVAVPVWPVVLGGGGEGHQLYFTGCSTVLCKNNYVNREMKPSVNVLFPMLKNCKSSWIILAYKKVFNEMSKFWTYMHGSQRMYIKRKTTGWHVTTVGRASWFCFLLF